MVNSQRISTVRSLVCHCHVDMAITCLGSLVRFSEDPVRLVLHEDGSLSDVDVVKLLNGLPGAQIVYRQHADEILDDLLQHHPRCRQYRNEQPYALKLLDVPLMCSDDLAFCDTDVLFFRRVHGLLDWPDDGTAAVFMTDCMEAYSVRPWHLIGGNKVQLPSRVNVGLFLFRKRAYDLDFIEWCLRRQEFHSIRDWIEQTCWAALGQRSGCRRWDERHIAVMRPGMAYDGKVAVHFVSPARKYLPAAIERRESADALAEPVEIATVAAEVCQPVTLARYQAELAFGVLKDKIWRPSAGLVSKAICHRSGWVHRSH